MKSLASLSNNFDIFGLKTSFEDEGASFNDVLDVLRLTNIFNLKSTIKIGGCEARTDIHNCLALKVNNIVAPMVESKFATKKFIDSFESIYPDTSNNSFYVNIESIQAVRNAKDIIEEACAGSLKGIVVGRSDLSKSIGLTKSDTNSDRVFDLTREVLLLAKDKNLETTIGGNLNSESLPFITKLFEEGLLDRVETRLVICNVDKNLLENYSEFISLAISLEKEILEDRLSISSANTDKIKNRLKAISGRSGFLNHVNESEKSVLVIDFDNVIHNMTMGYHDGTIYGDPLEGTGSALETLSKSYKIIVYTCKANPRRPLVNGKTGVELINEWLSKKGFSKYIDHVTFGKPNAVAYIDDKAIEFTTWEKCLIDLREKGLLKK